METTILKYLMLQKFTTRSQLLASLRGEGIQIGDRVMRAYIESMINDGHYCIQSSEKGYSLIHDDSDLDNAVAYLDAKAEAIAIRKNCLIRNFNETKKSNQLVLL